MDWNEILKRGGVPDSPGRQEAIERALERSRQKSVKKPKPAKTRGKKKK